MSIGRQIGHTLGTKLIVACGRALLVIVLAKALTPGEFGAYSLISTSVALLLSFTGLNLGTYIYRSVPGLPPAEARRILSTIGFAEVFLTALLAGLGLLLGAIDAFVAVVGANEYLFAFRLAVLLLLSEVLCQDLLNFLLGSQAIQQANILDAIKQVGWVVPIIIGWLAFGQLTLTTIILLNLVALCAAAIYGFAVIGPSSLPPPLWSLIRPAFAFAFPLLLPAVSFNLLKMADRYFLAAFRGLEDVAVYSFAVSLASLLYTFSSLVIASTLTPYAIRAHNEADRARRDRLLWQTLKYGIWTFAVGIVGLLVAGPAIVALVRPQYAAALGVLPWAAAGYLAIIIATPANNYLFMEGRTLTILRIDVLGAVLALVLDVTLIPVWGYYGAAAATGTGFGIITVWKYAASGIWKRLPWSELVSTSAELRLVRAWARPWLR